MLSVVNIFLLRVRWCELAAHLEVRNLRNFGGAYVAKSFLEAALLVATSSKTSDFV